LTAAFSIAAVFQIQADSMQDRKLALAEGAYEVREGREYFVRAGDESSSLRACEILLHINR
jgi:hypothetical protein